MSATFDSTTNSTHALITEAVTNTSNMDAANVLPNDDPVSVKVNNTTSEESVTLSEEDIKEQRKARGQRHTESIKARHAKAEQYIRLGDEALKKEETFEAIDNYAKATGSWRSNEKAATKLLEAMMQFATYSRDSRTYRNAENFATLLLMKRPKLNMIRWYRGTARLAMMEEDAAVADFYTILAHEPEHEPTLYTLLRYGIPLPPSTAKGKSKKKSKKSKKSKGKGTGGSTEAEPVQRSSDPMDLVYNFPPYESPSMDYESSSETSDKEQVGNHIPCKHYNKKPDGCKPRKAEKTPAKNGKCRFMHAPDMNSVRDTLGRNVCLYYLIGRCKFGDDKCFYCHERIWLAPKGWWNDEKQTEMMKEMVVGKYKDISGRGPGPQAGLQQWKKNERREMKMNFLRSIMEEEKVAIKAYKTRELEQMFAKMGLDLDDDSIDDYNEDDDDDMDKYDQPGYELTVSDEERFCGPINYYDNSDLDDYYSDDDDYGFDEDDLEELACQGVKPWDDDAHDLLHALRSY